MNEVLFNALTDNDKEMISEYIADYAGEEGYCDSCDRASLDVILRYWSYNKERLFHMFGDQLILRKDINIRISDTQMECEINKHLMSDTAAYAFRNDWYRLVSSNASLIPDRYFLMDLLAPYALAANKFNTYRDESVVLSFADGTKIVISDGCKPVKMIGKILKALVDNYPNDYQVKSTNDLFENFRLWHSRMLNTRTMSGKLCLSIHPLDYMTMSDNENDWHSCMSWKNHGEYRQGTVEMMNSPIVVVAYLESETARMKIAGYPWNSKKWRELFIVNSALITEVKPYPYIERNLTTEVIDWLTELAINAGLNFSMDTEVQYFNDSCDDLKTCGDDVVNLEFETRYMYNDFSTLTGGHMFRIGSWTEMPDAFQFENYADSETITHYQRIISDNNGNTYKGPIHMNIFYSGESECMFCGENIDCSGDYDGEELANRLTCADCEPIYYCDCCGDRCNRANMIEIDGQLVCQYCYENHTYTDFIDGEVHWDEYECMKIYVARGLVPDVFSDDYITVHSSNVLDKNMWYEYFNTEEPRFDETRDRWGYKVYKHYVLKEDFEPEGLAHFYDEFGVDESYFNPREEDDED